MQISEGTAPRHPVQTSATLDDDTLIELTLKGSADAFRRLVERYQRPVLSLVGRMVEDRSAAEDLTQEVFLRAYRHLAEFELGRKFSSWLFRIAHNRTIDYLRRQRLVGWQSLEAEGSDEESYEVFPTDDVASPQRLAESSELRELFRASLAALRPNYREVLLLRFEQDLQYQEIADILGVALGTVKILLHRARKALANELARRGVVRQELEAPV